MGSVTGQIIVSKQGKEIIIGSTQPSDPVINDLWLDITNDKLKKWNGTEWAIVNNPSSDIQNALQTFSTNYYTKSESDSKVESIIGETTIEKYNGEVVNMKNAISQAVQNSDKFEWLVSSGTSKTDMVLTSELAKLTTKSISMNAEKIDIIGDRLTINSNNFKLDSYGKIEANSGTIGGFSIGDQVSKYTIGDSGVIDGEFEYIIRSNSDIYINVISNSEDGISDNVSLGCLLDVSGVSRNVKLALLTSEHPDGYVGEWHNPSNVSAIVTNDTLVGICSRYNIEFQLPFKIKLHFTTGRYNSNITDWSQVNISNVFINESTNDDAILYNMYPDGNELIDDSKCGIYLGTDKIHFGYGDSSFNFDNNGLVLENANVDISNGKIGDFVIESSDYLDFINGEIVHGRIEYNNDTYYIYADQYEKWFDDDSERYSVTYYGYELISNKVKLIPYANSRIAFIRKPPATYNTVYFTLDIYGIYLDDNGVESEPSLLYSINKIAAIPSAHNIKYEDIAKKNDSNRLPTYVYAVLHYESTSSGNMPIYAPWSFVKTGKNGCIKYETSSLFGSNSLYITNNGISLGNNFNVNSNGDLYSKSGAIGDFYIGGSLPTNYTIAWVNPSTNVSQDVVPTFYGLSDPLGVNVPTKIPLIGNGITCPIIGVANIVSQDENNQVDYLIQHYMDGNGNIMCNSLESNNNITTKSLNINGAHPQVCLFGTCSTARNTAAKTVTITGINTLYTGMKIAVRFSSTVTSNPSSGNITLNVNDLGAKEIVIANTNYNKASYGYGGDFYNNKVCEFMYDGTYWVFTNRDTNTTYSVATTSANGLMSSTDKTKLDSMGTHSISTFYCDKGTATVTLKTPSGTNRRVITIFITKGVITIGMVGSSSMSAYTAPSGVTVTYNGNSSFTFTGLTWYEMATVLYPYQ